MDRQNNRQATQSRLAILWVYGLVFGCVALTLGGEPDFEVQQTTQPSDDRTNPVRSVSMKKQPTEFIDRDQNEAAIRLAPTLTNRSAESIRRISSQGVGASLIGLPQFSSGTLRLSDPAHPSEAPFRATTDAGNLFDKVLTAPAVSTQAKNPIINEPKIRGNRIARQSASGSYWVPARIDLDTMLSKLDSRIIREAVLVKGPYTSRHGPDFRFMNADLMPSPRSLTGDLELGGTSSFDFKSNGEQWYARKSAFAADEDWGVRVGYGHRTGNDYREGGDSDVSIPTSYKSRELDVAAGFDLSATESLEFHALRLDQTDVELPGQAFDIDYLVTDAYEVEYVNLDPGILDIDSLGIEGWWNNTRFRGSAQRTGKRRIFPFLDFISYRGETDVDSTSTGFKVEAARDFDEYGTTTAGVDLRVVRQALDEFSSGMLGVSTFTNANSPLPKSYSANPGLFIEHSLPVDDDFQLTAGARVDWMSANVVDGASELAALGLATPQATYEEIVGTDQLQRDFNLWAAYLIAEKELSRNWTLHVAAGHAERPPSLTELYVAESFLFLLQNGLNTATGDPELDAERLWQIDVGVSWDYHRFRGRLNGFHAWINDYITFENTQVNRGPPFGQVEQIALQYVNTELATLAGFELDSELDLKDWLTAFTTVAYVEGRDRDRNGDFATRRGSSGSPKTQVAGLPRGAFSFVGGGEREALPMMPPLEGRFGVRIHEPTSDPRWGVEVGVRVVDEQDRVAESLLESRTPGFAVWDIRGYWEPTAQLAIYAGVENFTDKSYREHFDFQPQLGRAVFQPGINFYVGSEYRY